MKPGACPEKYGSRNGQCSIRNSRYSLVYAKNEWELYDLKADPGQAQNIADQHPEVVKQLSSVYDQWWLDVQPSLVNEDAYKSVPKVNPFKAEYWEQSHGDE